MKHTATVGGQQGQQVISDAREAWRSAWRKACEYDGTDPGAMFVIFSEDNPFVSLINQAHTRYWETLAACQADGDVGPTVPGKE